MPVLALGETLQLRNLYDIPSLQQYTYKRLGFPGVRCCARVCCGVACCAMLLGCERARPLVEPATDVLPHWGSVCGTDATDSQFSGRCAERVLWPP